MAGFQLTTNGRIWVSTEDSDWGHSGRSAERERRSGAGPADAGAAAPVRTWTDVVGRR